MRLLNSTILAILILLLAGPAWSGSYNYLSAAELKQTLDDRAPVFLVDIQEKDDFAKHHLPGVIDTYAYPVKTEEDRRKLDVAVTTVLANDVPVVIVCPRGGGGAKRAYDQLAIRGVASERLFILENGQQGWPYPELLADSM